MRPGILVGPKGEKESAEDKRHKHNWALIEPLVTGDNER